MSSDDLELEFVYNDEGIRTQKIVNGVVHTYHLSGTDIIAEEWGNNLIIYLYDSNGSPMGMQYRRSSMAAGEFYTFWFEKNLQGDIVASYNSAGTKVISYSYDAWGNCITTHHNVSGTNSYASFNHFRYRGYYFDSELGFYYLNSRYYDPSVGRFINADVYVSTGQGLLGYNMFVYCLNDPVSHKDDQGTDTVSVTEGEDNGYTLNEMILSSGGGGSSGSGNGSGSAGGNSGYSYNFSSNTKGVSGGTGNTGTTTGYETFANFKSAYGSAGENMHWRHIVEQCQINCSCFSPYSIHHINNIIAVDSATHKLISAHYSSKLAMNGTMVVRDWLATQDFGTQYEYGMKIYRQFSQKEG